MVKMIEILVIFVSFSFTQALFSNIAKSNVRISCSHASVSEEKISPRLVTVAAAALIALFQPMIATADLNDGIGFDIKDGVQIVRTDEVERVFNPVEELSKQATMEQIERVKSNRQQELRESLQDSSEIIARIIVQIKSDAYPLGFPDVSSFPMLDVDGAKLIATAFGRSGPPVASKRINLKGLKFPAVVTLTDDDLTFPLTKSVWKSDTRSKEDIGVAVVLDVDGKLATLDGNDLTGYAVSRYIKIGGQSERSNANVVVQTNKVLAEKGQDALPDIEIAALERIDAQLDYREQQSIKKLDDSAASPSKKSINKRKQ